MSQPIEMVVIGAGHRGADAYAAYAFHHPEEVRFVGVAEPDPVRRERFAQDHDLDESQCFTSWEDLIDAGQLGRAAIVATQDQMHVEPAVAAMEAGYDVLLEKPMAHTLAGAVKLVQTAERTGRILEICHVLRYSPFWVKLHEIVTSDRLGDIITVEHRENVSYWHMSHSFVRGNWRNEGLSSPMILAKCCHDLDILYWNLGVKTANLSSFGSLIHYRAENAGPEIPLRCTDGCPIEAECPFSAIGIYLEGRPFPHLREQAELLGIDPNRPAVWPFTVLTPDPTLENMRRALETGPYGRCVYHCDNDVVDNQVVAMELEDGRTVTLVMHGHSHEEGRTMRYDGSKATLRGRFGITGGRSEIAIHDHASGDVETIDIPDDIYGAGHGGGDAGLMADFLAVLRGEKEPLTTARESLESHLLAFAAEESRHGRSVVDMEAFRARAEEIGEIGE